MSTSKLDLWYHIRFSRTIQGRVYAPDACPLHPPPPSEHIDADIPSMQAVEDLTLETTGRFVAPQGSESLGLGVYALDNPSEYGPFCELPW